MNKIRKWALLILLISNIIVFLKNYIGTGNVNLAQLCVIFGITPIAIKDIVKFTNNKQYMFFSALMLALAVLILILQSIKYM